jgi:DNA-binding MarR family transcriptional regulator
MTSQDAGTPDGGRSDLAAVLHPLTQALIDAELPVLAAHGLTMWGYVVLNALDGGPVRTQAALAEQISADKTRIISTLDRLQAAGLITRHADPGDRRVRLLAITPAGRERRAAVQAGIQANEEHLLSLLPAADREGFLRSLRVFATLSRAGLTGILQPGLTPPALTPPALTPPALTPPAPPEPAAAQDTDSSPTGSPTQIRPGPATEP